MSAAPGIWVGVPYSYELVDRGPLASSPGIVDLRFTPRDHTVKEYYDIWIYAPEQALARRVSAMDTDAMLSSLEASLSERRETVVDSAAVETINGKSFVTLSAHQAATTLQEAYVRLDDGRLLELSGANSLDKTGAQRATFDQILRSFQFVR